MSRRHRCLAWTAAALLAGLGYAWQLEVDPTGGPIGLEDEVLAALADWRAAGVDPEEVAARVTVRYGSRARFGPDVLAWVLVRDDAAEGERAFEILIAPDATAPRAALIPALGVALGGALGRGAFDPVLDPAGPRRPTAADGLALEERRTALPGDLNRDGRVDFEDLLLLAEAYGRRGVNLPADLDGDGVVDAADLELLRGWYTFDPPGAGD